jgi:site-specific DNA-methyltransferase (adenine-specific)
MGKDWDHAVPGVDYWQEIIRVLKPGAHMLAFGGTRTFHRLACAIEDSGFEIRDTIMWIYGSGFPKSLDVSKAMDKLHGIEARKWEGWGTALKPAYEPILMCRKPFKGTVAQNVLKHGTGGINIDGCRIDGIAWKAHKATGLAKTKFFTDGETPVINKEPHENGRWPANVITDGSEEVIGLFPSSKGQQGNIKGTEKSHTGEDGTNCYGNYGRISTLKRVDNGSAARFFYTAKASKSERGEGNNHPTVKPMALIKYLITMVCPDGATILDPFTGSGTVGKAAIELGRKAILIELNPDYCKLINKRTTTMVGMGI